MKIVDLSKISNLGQYRSALSVYTWDELASDLIHLEQECASLGKYLNPRELKMLNKLIAMYEEEKSLRLKKTPANYSNLIMSRVLIATSDGPLEID